MYVPVVPPELLDIVQAPVPFLAGVHTSCVHLIDSFQVRQIVDVLPVLA